MSNFSNENENLAEDSLLCPFKMTCAKLNFLIHSWILITVKLSSLSSAPNVQLIHESFTYELSSLAISFIIFVTNSIAVTSTIEPVTK